MAIAGRTTYELGRDNVQFLGLDVHNPVFAVSSLTIIAFVTGVLAFRDVAAGAFNALYSWLTSTLDWVFMGAANIVVLFCLVLLVTPVGRIRLGGPDARPDYSAWSWFAMLFAAGIGIGLMFFGVAEPLDHFLSPPLGLDPADGAAAHRLAIASAIFHWGVHAWGRCSRSSRSRSRSRRTTSGLPLTLRSGFYPILGEAVWGRFGHVIDILAVFATLFGLATSLGLGTEQTARGAGPPVRCSGHRHDQGPVEHGHHGHRHGLGGRGNGPGRQAPEPGQPAPGPWCCSRLSLPPARPWNCCPGSSPASATTRRRSDRSARGSAGTTPTSCTGGPPSSGHGGFRGRPSSACSSLGSRGAARCAPSSAACWSCRCWSPRSGCTPSGATALSHYVDSGQTGAVEAVQAQQPELALFRMLEVLPFSGLTSVVGLVLVVVFFVTSSDSGSLVIDTSTAGGKLDAPVAQRVFWCAFEGIVAITLLLGGGLVALQTAALATGFPFALLLLALCYSVLEGVSRVRGPKRCGPAS